MAEIKYEVVQRIAVLSERPRGWERQLNLISWNDGEPKYDIRDWSPDGTRMGKGIGSSTSPALAAKSCWTGWTIRPISLRHRPPPGSTVPVRAGCVCTA